MADHIDVTPTWSGLMPALLQVLEHGPEAARQPIREELLRMATIADSAKERMLDIVASNDLQCEVQPEAGWRGRHKLYIHLGGRTIVRICKLMPSHWTGNIEIPFDEEEEG